MLHNFNRFALCSPAIPAQIRNLELIHLHSHNDLNLLSFSFRWASFRHIQSGEPHGPTWGHRLFALCHQKPRKQIGKLDTDISLQQQLPKLFTIAHRLGILLSVQVRQVKEEIYLLLLGTFSGWSSHGFWDTRLAWDIFEKLGYISDFLKTFNFFQDCKKFHFSYHSQVPIH